jgi:hypothetical protein
MLTYVDGANWPAAGNRVGMLLLYGGSSSPSPAFDASTLLDDVWQYEISSGTWTQLRPSGTPPPAMVHAKVQVQGGEVVVWGGQAAGPAGAPVTVADFYVLELVGGAPRWRRASFLAPAPGVEPAGKTAMVALTTPPLALLLRSNGEMPQSHVCGACCSAPGHSLGGTAQMSDGQQHLQSCLLSCSSQPATAPLRHPPTPTHLPCPSTPAGELTAAPLPRRVLVSSAEELSSARPALLQDGDTLLLRGTPQAGIQPAHTVVITGAVALTGDVQRGAKAGSDLALTDRVLLDCSQSLFCLLTRCTAAVVVLRCCGAAVPRCGAAVMW